MILVVNGGSSSFRWALFDPNIAEAETVYPVKAGVVKGLSRSANYQTAFAQMRLALEDYLPLMRVVVYRVVHGGEVFSGPVEITSKVLHAIRGLTPLAPLHQGVACMLIGAGRRLFPHLAHVAVFDTAFFHNLPLPARTYALPWEWTQRYTIRRYGFHGHSHKAAAKYAVQFFRKRHPHSHKPVKIVTVHLGQGMSVTALEGLEPRDTTMGFTPQDGVPMMTRSGALDPDLIEFLIKKEGLKVFNRLRENAGISAVAGTAPDMRDVLFAGGYPVDDSDWEPDHTSGKRTPSPLARSRARLAIDILLNHLVKAISAYRGILGGLDVVCFTGGIGAESTWLRENIVSQVGKTGSFYAIHIKNAEEREMALEAFQFIRGEFKTENR